MAPRCLARDHRENAVGVFSGVGNTARRPISVAVAAVVQVVGWAAAQGWRWLPDGELNVDVLGWPTAAACVRERTRRELNATDGRREEQRWQTLWRCLVDRSTALTAFDLPSALYAPSEGGDRDRCHTDRLQEQGRR